MQTFDGSVPNRDHGTSDHLKIGLEPDPQGVRVRLVGELDLATAPELDRVLDELAGNGHDRLLIDLDDLVFMDSTGLASMFRAQRAADANGHRLMVRGGSRRIHRLFELAGVLDLLMFED